MEKALLITYYWPPAGGAGVHRWLRMSTYFRENNIELTVFSPENPSYPILDRDLLKKIDPSIKNIKGKILEPSQLLGSKSKGSGFTFAKKKTIATRILIWIRSNLFIPDARFLWIQPSYKSLSRFLAANPDFKYIISSGPPHSAHMIALKLKKKKSVKWIADFRDPWTGIDFYKDLTMTKWADKRQKKLELNVLKLADKVITVSSSISQELSSMANVNVEVVTNGFIFDLNHNENLSKTFNLVHFGSIPFSRNPLLLWQVLKKLKQEKAELVQDLKIEFFGNVDSGVLSSAKDHDVDVLIELKDSVSHAVSLAKQREAQLLLLIVNNSGNVEGTLTGKFFEYLNSKRPIVTLGPKNGDLSKALSSTGSGQIFDTDNAQELEKCLIESYELFRQSKLHSSRNNLEQFESKYLAKKFIEIMRS